MEHSSFVEFCDTDHQALAKHFPLSAIAARIRSFRAIAGQAK
jgi:hypothetical protein